MQIANLTGKLCVILAIFFLPAAAQVRDLRLEKEKEEAIARSAKTSVAQVGKLPPASKRWALIIGVDNYNDRQISPLYAAANDANALANAFTRYAGFPKEQVILLSSSQPEERQPTRGNVLLRLANLSKLVPKDGLLLFAFAGHGIERNNQAFLLPSDAKMSDNIRILQSTALSVTEIKDWVQEMEVKQVIILLDACRNDPTSGRSDTPNPMTEAYRKGFDFDTKNNDVEAFATLYATRIGQRAYEYSEKKHGYFSWAVVEGLKGGAANDRGEVTLGSLETYIQKVVPQRISVDLGSGKEQRPFADVRGFKASELVLAKIDPNAPREPDPASAPDPRVKQLEEWQKLRASRDIVLLSEYRAKAPDGPFAEEAAQRIELLEWESAKQTNSAESYQAFLAKHPSGFFAEQARASMAQFEQKQTAAKSIDEVLRAYEEAYRNRDSQRVSLLWPALGKRDLGRVEDFFRLAKTVELRLDPVSAPQIDGEAAVIQCRRTLRFTDERGQGRPVEDMVTVRLRLADERWVIESVR